MIKVVLAAEGDRKVFLLGLTPENVNLLKQKQPIIVTLDDLGLPHISVAITYGRDQADLLADIKTQLGVDVPAAMAEPQPGQEHRFRPGG